MLHNNYEFFNDLVFMMGKVLNCGPTHVVVAGGAIRDSLLGKPIVDIDVFHIGQMDYEKMLKEGFSIDQEEEEEPPDYGDSAFKVDGNLWALEGLEFPIQFIQVKGTGPEHLLIHIQKFPCGVSKCILSSEGELILSPSFLNNEFFKVIEYSPNTPPAYKKKLMKKFPDYTHQ